MQRVAIKEKPERKVISISVKRQITIPQRYFNVLNFDTEAECILQEDGLLIRPMRNQTDGEFSEQILSDLIAQGFSGQTLLKKFKEHSRAIRPAVQRLLEEADRFAKSGEGQIPIDELFGAED